MDLIRCLEESRFVEATSGELFVMTISIQKMLRYSQFNLHFVFLMKFLFDEQVLCRMMGYTGPSEILKDKSFGPGRGPIWVDQLGCSGTESSLLECSKLPWAKHNCNHTEDAGIRCSEAPRTEKVNFNSNEFNCIKLNDIFVLIAYNNRSTESRRQRVTGLAGDFGLRSPFG